MLEIKLIDVLVPETNRWKPEIPIIPERFNSSSEPVDYPIVDPSLTSTSEPKNYK